MYLLFKNKNNSFASTSTSARASFFFKESTISNAVFTLKQNAEMERRVCQQTVGSLTALLILVAEIVNEKTLLFTRFGGPGATSTGLNRSTDPVNWKPDGCMEWRHPISCSTKKIKERYKHPLQSDS